MKWIIRSGVKIDRVACPSLIHNFVDREVMRSMLKVGVRPVDLRGAATFRTR